MRIERCGPASFQLTLHGYELTTLMAAARWAVERGEGELSVDAQARLRLLLRSYESGLANLSAGGPT